MPFDYHTQTEAVVAAELGVAAACTRSQVNFGIRRIR